MTDTVDPRRSTGDPALDADVARMLDDLGADEHRGVLTELFVSAVRAAQGAHDRLDLKIASAALREMQSAFAMFAPYRHRPKATIFGSARTAADDPSYRTAHDVAAGLAERGWMVVTGAGPGIMEAGLAGAGRENAIGVSIRLPFETEANHVIAGDEKLVEMKYFFTRKLMLVKESKGFVSLPGGFGTLDETFELLTLQQTGKADPVPIVLLDEPGGTYWTELDAFVRGPLVGGGLVAEHDVGLYLVTDDVGEACRDLIGFYRNFHSMRYVGDRLVLRLGSEASDELLADLDTDFADLTDGGGFERTAPLRPEIDTDDELDRPRIVFRYGPRHYGRLRPLVDRLNADA
ncbi:MAG: TIGR00730 family Rossman fold protein [Actinomycetota bacterium]